MSVAARGAFHPFTDKGAIVTESDRNWNKIMEKKAFARAHALPIARPFCVGPAPLILCRSLDMPPMLNILADNYPLP